MSNLHISKGHNQCSTSKNMSHESARDCKYGTAFDRPRQFHEVRQMFGLRCWHVFLEVEDVCVPSGPSLASQTLSGGGESLVTLL